MAEYLMNATVAQMLSEKMPDKTAEQWTLWLQNNRNLARKTAYRIPYQKMGGAIVYNSEELEKYIEWQKSRKLGKFIATARLLEVLKDFGIKDIDGSSKIEIKIISESA